LKLEKEVFTLGYAKLNVDVRRLLALPQRIYEHSQFGTPGR
jgi:hypothetical protein